MEAAAIPIEDSQIVPITIKEAIEAAQEKYLAEKIFRSRWKSVRASGIDDACNRRLFYYMTAGELADDITVDLVSIFEEGKEQEPGVRRFLSELGFEVKKASFTENWDKYNISGGIDGIVEFLGKQYVAEIKTVSEYAWKSLQGAKDFNEGYYKKWFGQMQTYLLLFNLERGVFILKRKQAKQIRIIEVALDYGYAENLLKKAELVNEAIKINTPPDFLKDNPVECKRCSFFAKVCNPPLNFGDVILNVEDPELEKKLIRRDELSDLRSEYESLDKEVKERFRDIPAALCGNFSITGKAGTMKMKAQEARELQIWKTKIEKITELK